MSSRWQPEGKASMIENKELKEEIAELKVQLKQRDEEINHLKDTLKWSDKKIKEISDRIMVGNQLSGFENVSEL